MTLRGHTDLLVQILGCEIGPIRPDDRSQLRVERRLSEEDRIPERFEDLSFELWTQVHLPRETVREPKIQLILTHDFDFAHVCHDPLQRARSTFLDRIGNPIVALDSLEVIWRKRELSHVPSSI